MSNAPEAPRPVLPLPDAPGGEPHEHHGPLPRRLPEPRDPAAFPPLSAEEGPFEWARWMLPASPRLLGRAALARRLEHLAAHPDVRSWAPPEALLELARREAAALAARDGSPLPAFEAAVGGAADPLGLPPYLFLGDGPLRVVLLASPHADEPVGVATAVAFLEALLRPGARALRRRLRVAVAPLAHPAGLAANEPWFGAVNELEALEPGREFKMRMMSVPMIRGLAEPRPGNLELADAVERALVAMLRGRRRDLPDRDVEFGYAEPAGADPADPAADFLPACRCHAAFLDEVCHRWGGIDLLVPLHSMAFAGGAYALVRAPDPADPGPDAACFFAPYRYAAGLSGLGLHDEDRGGAKGFRRLGPGFATTPTGAAMRAWFRARGEEPTIRFNSMDWAGARARRVAVPEVPQFLSRWLADRSEGNIARREALRLRAGAAQSAANWLEGCAAPRAAAAHEACRADAADLAAQAADRSERLDEPATHAEITRARLEQETRPAAAMALREEAGSGTYAPDEAIYARAARGVLMHNNVRPVALKHQVMLQTVLVLAGVGDLV